MSNWRSAGRVAGLDLSLNSTGVLILTEDALPLRWFTIKHQLSRRSKKDPPISDAQRIQRLVEVANAIVGLMKDYKVRRVGIEGYAHAAKFQAHQLGELGGTVRTQLFLACGIVADSIPPGHARKHVLGYGSPIKEEVVRVVREGFKCPVDDDHQADAFIIARYEFDKVVAEQKELGAV